MAMAIVLISLGILFMIAIPFATMMKVEKRMRSNALWNVKAKLAAEGILDYSVSRLTKTCDHNERYTEQEALWKTPDYDSPKEYDIAFAIPDKNLSNPRGDFWSVSVEDEQGKIHINSASPWLLGNVIGSAIIKEPVQPYDSIIIVDSTFAFSEASGYLWVEGELISYEKKAPDRFTGCRRGLYRESPRFIEPQSLKPGMLVVDARAHRICSHRISRVSNAFVPYRTLEEIRQIGDLSAYTIDASIFSKIEPFLTVYPLYNAFIHEQILENDLPHKGADETKGSMLKIQNSSMYRPGMTIRIKQGNQEVYAMVIRTLPGQIEIDSQIKEAFLAKKAIVSILDAQPVHINTAHPKTLYSIFKGIQAGTSFLDAKEAGILATSIFGHRQEGGIFKSHADLSSFLQELRESLQKNQTMDSNGQSALNYQEINAILSQAYCTTGYKGRFSGIARFEGTTLPDKEKQAESYPMASLVYRNQDTYTLYATAILHDAQSIPLGQNSIKRIATVSPLESQLWRLESQKDFEEQRQRFSSYRIITKPNLLQPFLSFPESNPENPKTGIALDAVSLYPPRSPQGSVNSQYYTWDNTLEGIVCPKDPPPSLKFQMKDREIVPGSLSFWFYPLARNKQYIVFDMGKGEWEDRICLSYQNNAWTLILSDASMEEKALQIHYPFDMEEKWYHIIAAWYSTNPGGASLWINGEPKGEFQYLAGKSVFKATLAENITKESKRIAITDTNGLESEGVVQIGEEAIEYSQIIGNNLIVRERYENYNAQKLQRGARSTIASEHSKGVMVNPFGYTEYLRTKIFPAADLHHDLPEGGNLYSKLSKELGLKENKILANTKDFPPRGFVLVVHQSKEKKILHEIIKYGSTEGGSFSDCDRNQFSTKMQVFPIEDTYIFPISMILSNHKEYEKEGIVQIDNEWLSYEKKEEDQSTLVFKIYFSDQTLKEWISYISKGKKYQPEYRGVCGTQSSKHTYGTKVMPVFQTQGSKMGKLDQVTLIPGSKPDQKELHEVNWAYSRYAALKSDVKEAYSPDSQTRFVKFPSGELPGSNLTCLWGKSIAKASSASFLLDELQFSQAKSRSKCFLTAPVLNENSEINVNTIAEWPLDGGIAKIGDEYIAFSELENNRFLPPHRGFLKTTQGIYEAGTPVYCFFSLPATSLDKDMTPYASKLFVKNTHDFYKEGYLRIDDEILSYTSKTSDSFSMPEDKEDKGLLRGSFGSKPIAHLVSEVAYAFPTRYWDRNLKGHDGPEGAYFEAAKHAPGAFWKRVVWKEENPNPNYLGITVKVRANGKPEWDTKPTNKEGSIFEFTNPKEENRLEIEADFLEIRIYFPYKKEAFAKGQWTQQAMLKSLFVEYQQPPRTWENINQKE